MSWAEVKKINSNLNKPLDEILVDVKNSTDILTSEETEVYQTVSTSGIPLVGTPLTVSISGSGRLYGFRSRLLPAKNGSATVSSRLLLQADNQTVLDYTSYNETTNSTVYANIMFSTPDLIITFSQSPRCYIGFANTSPQHYATENPLSIFGSAMAEPGLAFSDSVYGRHRFSLITKPIYFKQNFTATISAQNMDCTSTSSIFAVYILD